ncbi:MAG: TrkA C-terminal domain-containing protein [Ruminococcus callidus]
MLCAGDVAVLAAGHCGEKLRHIQLNELEITPEHDWNGKTLAALKLPKEELVIHIRRGKETVIPQGSTEILAGDVLVMYCSEKTA